MPQKRPEQGSGDPGPGQLLRPVLPGPEDKRSGHGFDRVYRHRCPAGANRDGPQLSNYSTVPLQYLGMQEK
jgi:hypothetical protein